MKARLPISNSLKRRVRQEIESQHKKQGEEATRRIFKLFCVSLNKKIGLGKQRLLSVLEEVDALSVESKKDEVFWSHIDRIVIDQIGINFERENYSVMDR